MRTPCWRREQTRTTSWMSHIANRDSINSLNSRPSTLARGVVGVSEHKLFGSSMPQSTAVDTSRVSVLPSIVLPSILSTRFRDRTLTSDDVPALGWCVLGHEIDEHHAFQAFAGTLRELYYWHQAIRAAVSDRESQFTVVKSKLLSRTHI